MHRNSTRKLIKFYKNEKDALEYFSKKMNRKKDFGGKYTGKDVKGYRIFGKAYENFEDEFGDEVENYINDICKESGF